MNMLKLSAVFVTGALFVAGANTSVFAASDVTNVFMNNAMPNIDFLDRSSRFALTNSTNVKLRDFAHSEAREQTLAANDLDDWISADKDLSVPGPSVVASTAVADGVMTGRSVAIDGQVPAAPVAAPIVDHRVHMGQEDLDSLEGLEGQAFDDQYKAKQLDALTQIQTDYQDYIAKGDDPVLKAMAVRELPKVKHRLALLGKV